MNNSTSPSVWTKNITLKSILAWLLGIIFALTGILILFSSPLAGIFFLLAAAVLIPYVYRKISAKTHINLSRNVRVLLTLGLLVLAGINMKSEKVTVSPVDTSVPVVSAQPVVAQTPSKPLTLEEKIRLAVTNSLGSQTNTDKPRLISVEVTKYKPSELATYGYKDTDSTVGVFIKINSDENLTTNLQKGTMDSEAEKVYNAVFPLSSDIGDIILWSHLPVTDKYGNKKDDVAIVFSMARPLFQKINWTNYNHRELPNLLKSEHLIDDRNNYHEAIRF